MHTRLHLPQVQCSDRDPLGFPDHLGTNQPWRHLWPLSRTHRGSFRRSVPFLRCTLGCSFLCARHASRGGFVSGRLARSVVVARGQCSGGRLPFHARRPRPGVHPVPRPL